MSNFRAGSRRVATGNFEYTEDELLNLDKSVLLKIAAEYKIRITGNDRKPDIIRKILRYQDILMERVRESKSKKFNQVGKFDKLPSDIFRLLASYLNTCDIVNLCKLTININNSLCLNQRFLITLGHRELTEYDERLPEAQKILKDSTMNDVEEATRKGYEKKVKKIRSNRSDRRVNAEILLRIAAEKGYLDLVKYLYSSRVQESAADTALLSAIQHGHIDVVSYFESKGINLRGYENDALKMAAQDGHLNTVEYAVSQGADIHTGNDHALRYAAMNGYLDIVEYLVENGADIHAVNDDALRDAAANGYLDVVKYLVENGSDIHANDDYALINAAENGHFDVVKYLVSQGADIHAQEDGALLEASNKGHQDIVEYLSSLDVSES